MSKRCIRLFAITIASWLSQACTSYGEVTDDNIEESRLFPGLIATYYDAAGNQIQRIDTTIAHDWTTRLPDERLQSRPIQAIWKGYLFSQVPGEYQIHAYVSGDLSVRLNGRAIIEGRTESPKWLSSSTINLPFDWHHLDVHFEQRPSKALVKLFWSGPNFELEPVPRQFLFRDRGDLQDASFHRGKELVTALQCTACHKIGNSTPPMSAPSLDNLTTTTRFTWIVDWLADTSYPPTEQRRMPSFRLSRTEARSIASFLAASTKDSGDAATTQQQQDTGSNAAGEELVMTLGCMACHRLGEFGTAGLHSGGDLTRIADKRLPSFFRKLLEDPQSIRPDHGMPKFPMDDKERNHIAHYLSSLSGADSAATTDAHHDALNDPNRRTDGEQLFKSYRCASCHRFQRAPVTAREFSGQTLNSRSDWEKSCISSSAKASQQPAFALNNVDRRAVERYVAAVGNQSAEHVAALDDHDDESLIRRLNCLACHARDDHPGIVKTHENLVVAKPNLAPIQAALAPPSLNGVGDKLHDKALQHALTGVAPQRRPWLKVRMPEYDLSEKETKRLLAYFVTKDRIPDGPVTPRVPQHFPDDQLMAARLVTSDGFGCTSCHGVGSLEPRNVPLNARSPNLTNVGQRIRYVWFHRWVRNPARMVPRMEMPSIQFPVRGVLGDDLERQLAAVWHALNDPRFQPPRGNPVRVARRSGPTGQHQRAVLITDVVRSQDERVYVKPVLIGLANRHNILVDLADFRLSEWWIGDAARQRTEGKSWYWEAGGDSLLPSGIGRGELDVLRGNRRLRPVAVGQFATELDRWQHIEAGIEFRSRVQLDDNSNLDSTLNVTQRITLPRNDGGTVLSGFRRSIRIEGLKARDSLTLGGFKSAKMKVDTAQRTVFFSRLGRPRIRLVEPPSAELTPEGGVEVTTNSDEPILIVLDYLAELSVDEFPTQLPELPSPLPQQLEVVPGFRSTRLPISSDVMPIAMAWRPNGELVVASLKGRVWLMRDSNGDSLEDQRQLFSDELAAPYGLWADEDYVDVVNKYALLRLTDHDQDGRAEITETLASGWGHTADYHDWTVGLPRDEIGNYYVATACEQDDRPQPAGRLRGRVLRLVPRNPTRANPHRFAIEPVSRGHRFPMGIARNRHGELFVTDNQGNYNPFNELNHVVLQSHFGFINSLDRDENKPNAVSPPAINIPHPWTRSVNGICFLETPDALRQNEDAIYGPLEGHLIGCEYDTRRLIRMSLQRVNGTYQGAVYPFSVEPPNNGLTFLGPIACSVSPSGAIYIGSIRDSGWGGANNVGELVRLDFQADQLPCGIAEVRATDGGFNIAFTRPVDPELASRISSYTVSTYRRISTPQYGGDDFDRRDVAVTSVEVAADAMNAQLKLRDFKEHHVYEIHMKNVAPQGATFFPAEAYFTLRRIQPPKQVEARESNSKQRDQQRGTAR